MDLSLEKLKEAISIRQQIHTLEGRLRSILVAAAVEVELLSLRKLGASWWSSPSYVGCDTREASRSCQGTLGQTKRHSCSSGGQS